MSHATRHALASVMSADTSEALDEIARMIIANDDKDALDLDLDLVDYSVDVDAIVVDEQEWHGEIAFDGWTMV